MQTLAPAQLSQELRLETSPDLTRRRWGIALSLVGAAIGGVVTAYQTGLIKRLPDILPGRIWDAEKVDASDYAYKRLQTPDATMMVATYAVTAAVISAGGKDRAEQAPMLPIAAALKAAFDFITCVKLGQEEWAENKALCSWCQVATGLSAATLALTLPEAVRASKALA
jgi:uncharacterized membrane protein